MTDKVKTAHLDDWIASLTGGPCWILMASRKLTEFEEVDVSTKFENFSATWNYHGDAISSQFVCLYSQALIVTSSESPGGCSRDSLFRFFKSLGANIGVEFTTGEKLAFLSNQSIELVKRTELDLSKLDKEAMWINTGISEQQAIVDGKLLVDPQKVF